MLDETLTRLALPTPGAPSRATFSGEVAGRRLYHAVPPGVRSDAAMKKTFSSRLSIWKVSGDYLMTTRRRGGRRLSNSRCGGSRGTQPDL
jgi:hypothetical protein